MLHLAIVLVMFAMLPDLSLCKNVHATAQLVQVAPLAPHVLLALHAQVVVVIVVALVVAVIVLVVVVLVVLHQQQHLRLRHNKMTRAELIQFLASNKCVLGLGNKNRTL